METQPSKLVQKVVISESVSTVGKLVTIRKTAASLQSQGNNFSIVIILQSMHMHADKAETTTTYKSSSTEPEDVQMLMFIAHEDTFFAGNKESKWTQEQAST